MPPRRLAAPAGLPRAAGASQHAHHTHRTHHATPLVEWHTAQVCSLRIGAPDDRCALARRQPWCPPAHSSHALSARTRQDTFSLQPW
eukprot:15477550-Alexandrium_andersonii.AAC.1